MTEDLVSICVVTMDRFELLRQCLVPSLTKAGTPFELLWWDNGSTDHRVNNCMYLLPNLAYARESTTNIGFAPAVNQLLLRSGGEYLCVLDPDMEMPEGWLQL